MTTTGVSQRPFLKRAGDARCFAVGWRNPGRPAHAAIGLLTARDGQYRFSYAPDVAAVAGFRPLLGFPELDKTYVSDRLFPFFAQRIMDRRRPDYLRHLAALDLPAHADALDVLGRSSGRRKADDVQVLEEPQVDDQGRTSCTFLVSGVRYARAQWGTQQVVAGQELALRPEPSNPVNPGAMLVVTSAGGPLGWVPDLLLPYVQVVLSHSTHRVRVVRINGPEQPDHLRLLVRLDGEAPQGWRPFGSIERTGSPVG